MSQGNMSSPAPRASFPKQERPLGQRAADLQMAHEGAMGTMLRNLAILAGVIILWAWTYTAALVSGRGLYILEFGAGVASAGTVVNALIRLRRVNSALANLTARHGKDAIDAAVLEWAEHEVGEPDPAALTPDLSATQVALTASSPTAVGYILVAMASAGALLIAIQAISVLQMYRTAPDEPSLGVWVYALAMGVILVLVLGVSGYRSLRKARTVEGAYPVPRA